MAAIVWADVSAFDSTLASVDSDAQDDILAHVNTALEAGDFPGGEEGARLRLARIYLAAHFAQSAVTGGTGAGGPVTRERAGELEVAYAAASAGSGLDETAAGRRFKELLRGVAAFRVPRRY